MKILLWAVDVVKKVLDKELSFALYIIKCMEA